MEETTGRLEEPILSGPGASDYERYLRTDELLALQKGPEERVHRDELLFQTVHQSSELWLKLAVAEVAAKLDDLAGLDVCPESDDQIGVTLQRFLRDRSFRRRPRGCVHSPP